MGSTRKSLHQSLGKNHMFGLGGSLDPPIPLLILRGHHKYCVWRCPKDARLRAYPTTPLTALLLALLFARWTRPRSLNLPRTSPRRSGPRVLKLDRKL